MSTIRHIVEYTGEIDPDTQASIDWLIARGWSDVQSRVYTRVELARPVRLPLIVGDEGIDVSRHNWPIDWPAVKAAGKRFAYIRASMGATGRDERYQSHRDGARAAGLMTGAYHLHIWDENGIAQAENFYNAVGKDFGELIPVDDVEPRGRDTPAVVDRGRSQAALIGFINRMSQLTRRGPAFYTNRIAWARMTLEPEWIVNYLLFVADYTGAIELPKHAVRAWMHQYQVAEAGTLSWHPGRLDLDRYLGDNPEPAPIHDLRDRTNQWVINLFYRSAVSSYIAMIIRAMPGYTNVLFTQRGALYTGPAIEAMILTSDERAQLIGVLEASPI